MRNFAEILKEEREKISLSQTDLGEKLNCSRYRVADLERGRITPTIEDIKFLCNFFGISSDYLLGISDVRTAETDIKAICEYTGLTERAVTLLTECLAEGSGRAAQLLSLLVENSDVKDLSFRWGKADPLFLINEILTNNAPESIVIDRENVNLKTFRDECLGRSLAQALIALRERQEDPNG